MVPDPVAFGELLEQREEESEVFADQESNLVLGWRQAWRWLRLSIFSWRRVDLFGKDMLEDESAVVPDGVVFGVLAEQRRRQAQRFGRVFLCLDLSPTWSEIWDIAEYQGQDDHLCLYIVDQALVRFNLLQLLPARGFRLLADRDAGHAVLNIHQLPPSPSRSFTVTYTHIPISILICVVAWCSNKV